ncbi:MAG: ChaN family lipoprotein [Pseudomonadota bacterium]|nr:ChaN family lipoprotein [Pseudomonadota bacterium]
MFILQGCSFVAEKPDKLPTLQTAYDFVLFDSQTRQPASVQQLALQLADADVIFIGEFHGNHASHLLQAQLQNQFYQQNPKQVLSMEQFNRDQQPILNQYLDDEVGEAYLINEAPAWENYAASYRPLVSFAKQNLLPVIAANAPADTVRCIGRQGQAYLAKLTEDEKSLIAEAPFKEVDGYREQFMEWLKDSSHFDEAKAEKSYLAQLTRDNTMAESILLALSDYPDHQIVHTNGAFHSNHYLGTAGALKRMNSELNIKVISPIHSEDSQSLIINKEAYQKGDFIYLLQPQPEKYVNASYRKQAFKAMFENADSKACR